MAPPFCELLPPHLSRFVIRRAAAMGLPDGDSYVVLLIRLEKQRLDLEALQAFLARRDAESAAALPVPG